MELVLYVQNMFNLTTNPVIAIGSSYSKHSIVIATGHCTSMNMKFADIDGA